MTTVITFGTFDLFHIGHLNILERAVKYGDKLVVGVSSDELNFAKKQRLPIYSCKERMRIIGSLKCVDEVFCEESLADKALYCERYSASLMIIGDDWKNKKNSTGKTFDEQLEGVCKVEYLERTPSISTTQLIEKISSV